MADATSPPAQPWYRRVVYEAALRGWTKAELCKRAGVARSTVDKWETNPQKPQSKSVNAVADKLGIPRAEALKLAGIIAPAPDPAQDEIPKELLDAYGQKIADVILGTVSDPAERRLLYQRLMEVRGGDPEPPPTTGPGAETPPGGIQRGA